MRFTVEELARKLGGRVEGDGTLAIRAVAGLREAQAGDVSFLGNPRYAGLMKTTGASAVLVGENWQGETRATLIRVPSADAAFAQAAFWLGRVPVTFKPGIHPTAVIADGVRLGQDVGVGPHCVIEAGAPLSGIVAVENSTGAVFAACAFNTAEPPETTAWISVHRSWRVSVSARKRTHAPVTMTRDAARVTPRATAT